MSFTIRISASANKEINLLPKPEISKVISKIEALSSNPRPAGCKKLVGVPEKL